MLPTASTVACAARRTLFGSVTPHSTVASEFGQPREPAQPVFVVVDGHNVVVLRRESVRKREEVESRRRAGDYSLLWP